jgi:hypothetical protein
MGFFFFFKDYYSFHIGNLDLPNPSSGVSKIFLGIIAATVYGRKREGQSSSLSTTIFDVLYLVFFSKL